MKKKLLIFFYSSFLNFLAFISPEKAGEKGFFLFCRPRRREVKPHHLEFLNTSERSIFLYAGKKVQVYQWGSGEKKLLLLHGWESHSYWWKRMITRLQNEKEFTIISVDAPGHGLSEGSYANIVHYSGLIEKILEEKGSFHALLGHSFGAVSSAYTMHRLPEIPVDNLVLMATPGELKQFVAFYKHLLRLSDRAMSEINRQFIKRLGHGPDYFSLKAFASTLRVRGLIIHDKDDKEAPYVYAEEAHQNWDNSRLITTSGLGHNLKSDELVEDVVKFLKNQE